MAELGALSLRIEETGGDQVLRQVKALDTQAKQTGISAETAAQALRGLGVAAKAVGGQVQVAEAEVSRASDIVRQLGSDAKVTAGEVERLGGQMAKLTPPKPFHGPGLPGTTTESAALASTTAARRQSAAAYAAEKSAILEGLVAIERRIGLLSQGARLDATRADSVRRLIAIEGGLENALQRGNVTAEQRVMLNAALARTQQGIAAGTSQLAGALNRENVAAQSAVRTQDQQTQGLQLFGREVTTTTGRLSAFSTRTISGLNAAAFSLSALASGGQASFRTLAQAAAGFAAFFGPGGAIASIALTAGLAITDFFMRTQREIEETKNKAKEALKDLRDSIESERRQGDQEGLIERVRQATANLAESEAELLDVRRKLALIDAKLEQVRKLSSVAAALLKRNEDEATKALRERRAALEANIPLLKQEQDLAGKAALNVREPAQPRTIETKITAQATKTAAEAEKERREAIAKTVAALVTLQKLDRQTGQDLVTLIALEKQLTDELARGNTTRERRAEIETQLASLRSADLQAPALRQPLGGGAVGAKRTIEIPTSVQTKLDPATIQADAQRTDAEMAARVAAFNFHETEQALSQSLGNALAAGIATGFAQGLGQGGIGEGFRQMTAQLAQGLGSVAIDYGVKAIAVSKFMAGISKFLIANPLLAIGLGIGLVAAGRAMGGRQGGIGGGGFGGGFGGGGSSSVPLSVSRLIVDPNAGRVSPQLSRINTGGLGAASPVQVLNVIGINTPQGQQLIGTASASYTRRGG